MSMRLRTLVLFIVPACATLPSSASAQGIQPSVQALTLQDAEKIAIQNHPQIQAVTNLAFAAREQTREARASYYPMAQGNFTGAKAENDSRVTAGVLNNPIVYSRFAEGTQVNQLVTDFGRTHELVKSSELHAKAEEENVVATRADVLLRVDQDYYAVLKSQAVLRVAEETVKARQLVADQVTELERNKLKSGLDVSFANVDLAQARLLLVQAQSDVDASYADLSEALGFSDRRTFKLVDGPAPLAPPTDVSPLIEQALRDRPELIGKRLDVGSAQTYATAERDLWLPTISAVGVAGLTPYRQEPVGSRYAAAGFNVNIPIFNGHLFNALKAQASDEARAQEQYLRDTQNNIIRDVQKAWLNAISGYQRLSLTEQLLDQSKQAFDLAQARYKLGLSSIIELSQAQLNMTQAEIAQASATYDYQAELSVLNYQVGSTH
jgi:outer membrane protein